MHRRKFAFLIHSRTFTEEIPQPLWRVRPPPVVWSAMTLLDQPNETAGWIIRLPAAADLPKRESIHRVEQGIERAIGLGADVVGLGSVASAVTGGGEALRGRTDVAITNGDAFTAATVVQGVRRLVATLPVARPQVAVVGACGSVGGCVVELLARSGIPADLLVGRDRVRLEQLAVHGSSRVSSSLRELVGCDVVVLAAPSAIRSEHLGLRARVLDCCEARSVGPELLRQRPDLRVIDGGWVSVPGLATLSSEDVPSGCLRASLAETVLLALAGQREHFGVGPATVAQALRTMELAHQHRSFGFGLAPFHSFGAAPPSLAPAA